MIGILGFHILEEAEFRIFSSRKTAQLIVGVEPMEAIGGEGVPRFDRDR